MATWLYQMNQRDWPPNNYRLDIWENERWRWPVGRVVLREQDPPEPGDKVVFFYAPTGGNEPGFYGWAIVLKWEAERDENREHRMYFRPVAPSDQLKMDPWWNEAASKIVDKIRGEVQRGTLWPVNDDVASEISKGLVGWLSRT